MSRKPLNWDAERRGRPLREPTGGPAMVTEAEVEFLAHGVWVMEVLGRIVAAPGGVAFCDRMSALDAYLLARSRAQDDGLNYFVLDTFENYRPFA